jgi:hypothetical protein
MSIVHRPAGGANERDAGDHAGSARADRLGGFEERLLAELRAVVAQHGATTAHPRARRSARRPRPLLLTGAASAALAAGLAAALIVTPGTARAPGAGGRPAFGSAATATAVLRNAALAALAGPAATPGPDQFVYSKVYTDEVGWPAPQVVQTWLSVGGTRVGLQSQTGGAAPGTTPEQACRNGRVFPLSRALKTHRFERPRGLHLHCTPADLAAYQPGMPTRPAALRAWLDRENHLRPGDAIGLIWVTEPMLATDYLTPAQRAATYDVLAQTPGLKIVPHTATLLRHTGVGVRWTLHTGPNKSSTYTLVFNRKTYQLLGMNWTGRLGLNGAAGGDVLTRFAIVSNAGQVP